MLRICLLSVLLISALTEQLFAQEGPYVPCAGCESLTKAPFPETGLWYNPDQSGSGFSLEFQAGRMVGFYFSYTTEGDSEWFMLNQPLARSETPGVMWEVEVRPERYSGGNCPTCVYQPPEPPEYQPAIRIEFLQRAYARLTLNDGSVQYMVPIIFGDNGKAFFAEQSPYLFPQFSPNPWGSLWSLVFKFPSEEEYAPWTWTSGVFVISEGVLVTSGPDEGRVRYRIWEPTLPPEVIVPFARIYCDMENEGGEPGCLLTASGIDPVDPPMFNIPIGNITDSRFFGESKGGISIEAFRLQYD